MNRRKKRENNFDIAMRSDDSEAELVGIYVMKII